MTAYYHRNGMCKHGTLQYVEVLYVEDVQG
jgi:hypothetical protein